MLSRIAESLYWVGRYVERAEGTARILDVHVMRILVDAGVDEHDACRTLLDAMGQVPPPGPLDAAAVLHVLAWDEAGPCSIVASLRTARDNARGIREVLSSEMWECLNATYHTLADHVQEGAEGPHRFFSWVKERTAIVAGLADSTMTRDEAWRFLVLGRSLERVDMTARLLWTCFGSPFGSADWVTTLRSCSAQEAFLRSYRRSPSAALVAEFLLLDRLFPRSALSALVQAEHCLAELAPQAGRAELADEARRVLGRARTELEFARVADLLGDLPSHLRTIQAACSQAGAAVAARYFSRAQAGWRLEPAVRL